jgi:UDP-3-O-[3-hydroxymyristoyl] glucosamine N-acyltransferase
MKFNNRNIFIRKTATIGKNVKIGDQNNLKKINKW